eukprot:gene12156-16277_t
MKLKQSSGPQLESFVEVEVWIDHIPSDIVILNIRNTRKTFADFGIVALPLVYDISRIPRVRDETEYKIYYCPVELYNNERLESADIAVTNWLKLISFSPLDGVCRFHIGLFEGSSGGAVANKAGEVIAVHVESSNSKMTVEDAKIKSNSSDMISV